MNNKSRFFVGIAFGVVALILTALAVWIGFGVKFQTSFVLGAGIVGDLVFGAIGVIATIQIAGGVTTSIKTARKQKAGAAIVASLTVLGFAVFAVLLIVMQFAFVGSVYNPGNLGLGILSAILAALTIAAWPTYGFIAAKLTK